VAIPNAGRMQENHLYLLLYVFPRGVTSLQCTSLSCQYFVFWDANLKGVWFILHICFRIL